MASKEAIKKAILNASGNPDSGIIVENVDSWAEAVWLLDNAKSDREVRIIEAKETR